MQRSLLLTLLGVLCASLSQAQLRSIIRYTVSSQQVDTIALAPIDTTQDFGQSSSNVGSLGGIPVQFPAEMPKENLFKNSQFTQTAFARDFFELDAYPVRTAVTIQGLNEGAWGHVCSGTLVGPDMVLTATHCIGLDGWHEQPLRVVPAYDEGKMQPGFPTSEVMAYYTFDGTGGVIANDVAMLQLWEPIGEELGWVSIAFTENRDYYTNKVFHKLSYPGVEDPFNPGRLYNGDTLYYQYGAMQRLNKGRVGIQGGSAAGIPGQSGSSIFYQNGKEYLSFGVLSTALGMGHAEITRDVYFQLRSIMDTYSSLDAAEQPELANLHAYPNPFREHTAISLPKEAGPCRLALYNGQGQQVWQRQEQGGEVIQLERQGLEAGLYMLQVSSESGASNTLRLLVRD